MFRNCSGRSDVGRAAFARLSFPKDEILLPHMNKKDGAALADREDRAVIQGNDPIDDSREDGLFVASLAKGMKILESFRSQRRGLSLTEITATAGIGKSAAQRAVSTLHSIGYLTRDEHTKTYSLSPKVLTLCWDYLSGSSLSDAAIPFLRELGEKFGETVNLSERVDDQLVVVGRMPGKQVLTINVGIGTRAPLISTAPGLVMLAFGDRQQTTAFIRKAEIIPWTSQTVTDRDRIAKWLEQIRRDGFAVARQLMHEGEISIAAPIFRGTSETAIAAINLSAPLGRWNDDAVRDELVPSVVRAAFGISSALARSVG